MPEASICIALDDLATIESILATSQVFQRHRGSLLTEAYRDLLPVNKIYDVINRSRECGPAEFIGYLQNNVRLPGGRSAELQFLAALRNETAPADTARQILDGIIEKYAPSQPQ
jgi:hypothetical protein